MSGEHDYADLNNILDQLDLDNEGGGVPAQSPNRIPGATELLANMAKVENNNSSSNNNGNSNHASPQGVMQTQQAPMQMTGQQQFIQQPMGGGVPQQQQQQQPQQSQQQQQVTQWQQQPPPNGGQLFTQQPQPQQMAAAPQQMAAPPPQHVQQVIQQGPPPPQQPGGGGGGTTVFMNGQYYQVPPGMQLAQVSNNGFELAPGQAGIPQQQQQQQQQQPQVIQQQQQQPMVMQVGPNGQLQPAPQQQQQFIQQQQGIPQQRIQQQQPPQQQQQQAQVLTVPPGMSVDQFIAQLQSQGLSGQVLTQNPQQQPPQQQIQQQQQQQQQPPTPQYAPPNQHVQQQGGQPAPSWARNQQGNSAQGNNVGGNRYQTQQAGQGIRQTPTTAESADDLTKLNPKAMPFVPKETESTPTTGRTSPRGSPPPPRASSPTSQQAPAAPPVKKEAGGPIACPHCNDTGFLTEYVLRSHIKAKHSHELINIADGNPVAVDGAAGGVISEATPAVTILLDIIRQFLSQQCKGGSSSLEALTTYLDSTHAVAMGEACSATTFSEVLSQGGIRRFSYTADELHRAEVKPEVATAAENRVALPNVDYMANDTARSKELH